MKLYNAPMPAPNPRRVRIFLAEKGVEVPLVDVAILKREHKSPEHMARNSLGQLPTLELDDGTMISETVAICRSKASIPTRRSSAAMRWKRRSSTCGSAASNSW